MNKLKILNDLKIIENRISSQQSPHIYVNLKEKTFTIKKLNRKISYIPSKTFIDFHNTDDYVRLIMGPYGSGKSSGCCAEILFRSVSIAPCKDGIRRSRWAIIRNTAAELETTTLKTWLDWFEELGSIKSHKKPIMELFHNFRDEHGKVELHLIFLALDRPEDIKKIKSLEVTGVFLNETSELASEVLTHMKARIPRYPSDKMIDVEYWNGIIADSNPPDIDSWIYRLFEIEKPNGYKIFKQPPGLLIEDDKYIINPNADNLSHMKERNYYLKLAEAETVEFIKVYCMGEYGTVISGRKVYENYNDDLHAVSGLTSEKGSQLILGWDFGLTPACLIAQLTHCGQIRVLKEFCTTYLSVRELAENAVYPYLISEYKGYDYISVGDPSDRPSDSTKQSCMQILGECGIYTTKAITNDIIPRIDAV